MVKEKYCPHCSYPKFRTNNLSINNCHWCNSPLAIREIIGRDVLLIVAIGFAIGILVGIIVARKYVRVPWEML